MAVAVINEKMGAHGGRCCSSHKTLFLNKWMVHKPLMNSVRCAPIPFLKRPDFGCQRQTEAISRCLNLGGWCESQDACAVCTKSLVLPQPSPIAHQHTQGADRAHALSTVCLEIRGPPNQVSGSSQCSLEVLCCSSHCFLLHNWKIEASVSHATNR